MGASLTFSRAQALGSCSLLSMSKWRLPGRAAKLGRAHTISNFVLHTPTAVGAQRRPGPHPGHLSAHRGDAHSYRRPDARCAAVHRRGARHRQDLLREFGLLLLCVFVLGFCISLHSQGCATRGQKQHCAKVTRRPDHTHSTTQSFAREPSLDIVARPLGVSSFAAHLPGVVNLLRDTLLKQINKRLVSAVNNV